MTSKEKALKIFKTYYTEWENREQHNESGYAYEQTYVGFTQKVQPNHFYKKTEKQSN